MARVTENLEHDEKADGPPESRMSREFQADELERLRAHEDWRDTAADHAGQPRHGEL